ncbi:hypothetical protein EDB19DRAFT_181104 [Suillus lakei]|nr:hypothetical protein EDB19DRAFT_181104 [Suillus lakei]
MFHPHELLARLSRLVHRSRPENDEANEESSTPSRLDPHVLLTRLSTLWSRPQARLDADKEIGPHPTTPLGSRPDAFISRLSSLFRSQPHANEEVELSECSRRPHVVEVATMRDREVLFVAPQQQPDRPHHQSAGIVTPGARPVHSRPIRLLGHLGLFLCCVCNHQHANGNAQSTRQEEGQSHGQVQGQASSPQTRKQGQSQVQVQVQAQASSSHTQPPAASTSATPPTLDTRTTALGAARP